MTYFLWLTLAWANATPEKITFHQALALALKQSPTYDQAVAAENTLRLQSKTAAYKLLPQADVEATHSYTTHGGVSTGASHEPWSNSLGLAISENLYDNGESWRAIQISGVNERIGALVLQRARDELFLRVAKAYYEFSSAAATTELERQRIDLLKVQYRAIEGRYRQGISSPRDYLRIKAQVQRAEVGFSGKNVELEQARQNLRSALGEPGPLDFEPLAVKTEKFASMTFPNIRVEDTVDYRITGMQDEVSDLKYKSAARNDWPRLSLKGSYAYTQPEYIGRRNPGLDDPYWNLQASLILDYALWDWGTRSRDVQIAANLRRSEKDGTAQTRIQVTQDVWRIKAQAELLHQSYKQTQQILKDDQTVFDTLNEGYRAGKVGYLELITALGDLFSSRAQLFGLQFNLLKAEADLAFYRGDLDAVLHNQ